jgi:hypothetical protein
VFCYVTAARLLTALSASQVVGGIDSLALWAGIISPNFFEPLSIPNRLDSLKVVPKLDPMRHCRLKLCKIIAGIVFTFAAKVDPAFSSASKHLAFLAIGQPLVRPTSIALAFLYWPISLRRQRFEPFKVFGGGNKPPTRFTVKAAYSSHSFIRLTHFIHLSLHNDHRPHY